MEEKDNLQLPENAFRELKDGEEYKPLMSPDKVYPEVNGWSVTWGIVMAIIPLSSENGKPVADPEIITRGFVYVKEAEALMGELKRVVNKEELKPEFKSTPTQFQTIIFASSDTSNVGDYDGDISEIKLTERQQDIIHLISKTPSISAKKMSETLSVSSRTVERDLSTLQKKGVLKREGKDNAGVWIVLI